MRSFEFECREILLVLYEKGFYHCMEMNGISGSVFVMFDSQILYHIS